MAIKYVKWYFAWCSRDGTMDNRNIKKYVAKKGDNIIDTVFGDNFTNNCTNDYTKKQYCAQPTKPVLLLMNKYQGK